MNTRDAILKAADHIERHPDQFDFTSIDLPQCGSPACALGWIAFFLGGGKAYRQQRRAHIGYCSLGCNVETWLGIDALRFYRRLFEIQPGWSRDARLCSAALRRYVRRYHPVPRGMPASVRAIFECEPA